MKGRFRWDKQYLHWGVTAFVVVICSVLFYMSIDRVSYLFGFVRSILNVLAPFFWGLIIAYMLTPFVKRLERMIARTAQRMFPKRNPAGGRVVRGLSIVLGVLIALSVLIGLLVTLLPQVYSSIEALAINIPHYATEVIALAQRTLDNIPALEAFTINLVESGQDALFTWVTGSLLPNMDTVIANFSAGVFSAVRIIVNLAIGIVLSIYIMYNRERFGAQIRKLLHSILPARRIKMLYQGVNHVDQAFGKFFLGRFLDALIIGVITFVALTLMRMPHIALVSVVIGITNIIPFFGPFIGGIPSALLILMEDPIQGLIFIVFIIVLQQIDGNIIGPKILANTTGLGGFWVLFSILVGGGLFGFPGMLLGVPVFSVVYDGIGFLVDRQLRRRQLATDTSAYMKKVPPPYDDLEDKK